MFRIIAGVQRKVHAIIHSDIRQKSGRAGLAELLPALLLDSDARGGRAPLSDLPRHLQLHRFLRQQARAWMVRPSRKRPALACELGEYQRLSTATPLLEVPGPGPGGFGASYRHTGRRV